MTVPTYAPAFSAKLLKQVPVQSSADKRFRVQQSIDLTGMLSDAGGIRVTKGIYDTAGGFQITLPDRVEPNTGESLYTCVEPMDLIEIRGSRWPHQYAGKQLPLVMRGWVDSVSRSEAMGEDGPQRTVTISGRDAGKFWNVHHVIFQAAYLTDAPYLTVFQMQAATGMPVEVFSAADFMRQLTAAVNRKLAASYNSHSIPPFTCKATVGAGCIIPNMAAGSQGSFWELAEAYCDRPWNELFILDSDSGPVVNFRPAPFRDVAGNFVMAGAADPGTILLDIADVVSLDVSRSDGRLANFFWVDPGANLLDSSEQVTASALQAGIPFEQGHANNDPAVYGVRQPKSHATKLLATGNTDLPRGDDASSGNQMVQWHIERMHDLRDMNHDNVVLEEGQAVVKGSELLIPGKYLKITRGSTASNFYLTRVSHAMSPFRGWTTSLALDRGDGFLNKIKGPAPSYWMEGRRGPYDTTPAAEQSVTGAAA